MHPLVLKKLIRCNCSNKQPNQCCKNKLVRIDKGIFKKLKERGYLNSWRSEWLI